MNGTFGFLTIWGDNKVDVVSTAMAIEVSSSRENEYVSEWLSLKCCDLSTSKPVTKCHAQENVLGQFPASMRYCSTYILSNGIN